MSSHVGVACRASIREIRTELSKSKNNIIQSFKDIEVVGNSRKKLKLQTGYLVPDFRNKY